MDVFGKVYIRRVNSRSFIDAVEKKNYLKEKRTRIYLSHF